MGGVEQDNGVYIVIPVPEFGVEYVLFVIVAFVSIVIWFSFRV